MSLARDVVIVDAVRTPIGRGHPDRGVLRGIHANVLLGTVYSEVIRRAGIPPQTVEHVVTGCVQQYGEQMLNIGRNAWLQAGLPFEAPATTVDCQCGSGQQAVNLAASLISSGANDVVIAAGVEHMGRVPLGSGVKYTSDLGTPWPGPLLERYQLVSQGIAAERVADKWGADRAELDEIALTSHRRAASAAAEGRFAGETVPLVGAEGLVHADQGIRSDTTLERLSALPAAFEEGGKITAGNASQISDGAAAVLLMSAERAMELGVEGRARIVDHVMTGSDPVLMLTGPMSATASLLARNGMTISNIDLAEVNEAFASVIAAWLRETNADPARVNVNGGAIALGHPLGASGARLVTTLLHELERRDDEVGLVTMCCAGGLGTGTLIGRNVN